MTTASPLNRTGLFQGHVDIGAKMVPFAGWEMPLQYKGILAEARAVRVGAGIFDVSHMGRLFISGSQSEALLGRILTANVPGLAQGRCRYCMICNEAGGIIDDVVIARLAEERFLLVCNASNRETVVQWTQALMRDGLSDVLLDDRTTATALIALQGPFAEGILLSLLGQDALEGAVTRPFGIVEATINDSDALISRTGYTGEDGVELVVGADQGPRVWAQLMELGAVPCGLGARDVLRLEAGLRLHGSDMDAAVTPLEAGLKRYVHMDGDFIGCDALQEQQERGLTRQLVGLSLRGRSVARHGFRLLHQGEAVGVVTSGTFSPTLSASIAMGYVPPELSEAGQLLDVEIRGEPVQVEVTSLPFYSRKRPS
jgi:aminomethyltransferase